MSKKGFTLTEILVVIALIGIIVLIVMPNLTSIFSSSIKKTMQVQEKEIEESALLYLEDFCKNKTSNEICPSTLEKGENQKYNGYINLNTLINEEYIDEVTLQDNTCSGCIIIKDNKASSYLICGNDYKTDTDVDFKTICNLT